jgi:predicted nucleotide-binding protein
MARITPAAALRPAALTADQIRQGIDRLEKRLETLKNFDPISVKEQFNSPELTALSASLDDALVRTFGLGTIEYQRYRDAAEFSQGPLILGGRVEIGRVRKYLADSQAKSIALLEQAIEALNERLVEIGDAPSRVVTTEPRSAEALKKVFVVHGHDGEPKHDVARFIETLGFEAIILHERPSQGRTIIEKFEEHADVGFAVILLTPDDLGRAKSDADLKPRARQNVVLELGYFIGRLGRRRVCALKQGNVEIPSDFSGVVYQPYDDNGGWKQALGRELQEAGYEIDWNLVMRR